MKMITIKMKVSHEECEDFLSGKTVKEMEKELNDENSHKDGFSSLSLSVEDI